MQKILKSWNARGSTPGKMQKLVANRWHVFDRSVATLGIFLTEFCQGLLLAKCRSIILFIIAPVPFIDTIFYSYRFFTVIENTSISTLRKKLCSFTSSSGITLLTCYNFMCIFFDCLFTYFFHLFNLQQCPSLLPPAVLPSSFNKLVVFLLIFFLKESSFSTYKYYWYGWCYNFGMFNFVFKYISTYKLNFVFLLINTYFWHFHQTLKIPKDVFGCEKKEVLIILKCTKIPLIEKLYKN